MNESRRRDFLKVAGGVAVVSGLAGCASEAQEDEEPPEDEEPEPDEPEEDAPAEEEEEEDEEPDAEGDGRIRVAHMIPDYPDVDVYVDDTDEPVFDGLGYTDVTDYVDLDGGDYQIRVTAAGARSLVLFDEEVSVPGGDTTAVALDESAEEEEAEDGGNAEINFQLELFEDDNTPPEETLNDSRLRLIHASPDAPNVEVRVGETPLFEDVGYGEGEYFDLPSGSYELDVYPANGEPADDEPGEEEPGADEEEEEEDDGFLSLTADGGVDSSLLQQDEDEEDDPFEEDEEDDVEDDEEDDIEDEEEEEDDPFEEEEEEEEDDDIEDEEEDEAPEDDPVFTFDADLEDNSVYTAFAAGYLDPDAAESENEFEVVIVEDVVDGEVVEVEDDD